MSLTAGRHAGVVLPVFSLRSRSDWGVGELPDVGPLCTWLAQAGLRSLHTLPLLERAQGERSPYGALSAFAIDPVHIGLDAVEDFVTSGGRAGIEAAIGDLRTRATIAYDDVRALKRRALERAFAAFERRATADGAVRAPLKAFRARERAWLPGYALFRALREEFEGAPWTAWPAGPRLRDATALRSARRRLARRIRFHEYVQWVAYDQLAAARRAATASGVALVGDLPFTVAVDSADVWARRDEFDVEASIGAPPDAFNDDGQDWGLPAFRWEVMEERGFAWLRERLAHAARRLDGVRLDHVVGYFRTYTRPAGGRPGFRPATEAAQRALGGAQLGVARATARGLALIAEDLGDVPAFVRDAMAARGVPGYRVLRWERDGDAFRDPRRFPACSVATSGTHDTSSLASWWTDELDEAGRAELAAVPAFAGLREAGRAFAPSVHHALVDGLYAAGSDVALVLFQDLYGGTERVNTPATVGDDNWGYRIPWTVEDLAGTAGRERADWWREVARRWRRAT